ncbi:hypothetical protein [Rhizobium laguerreae]|uniref:hypothetical protein n=1 Tax=Rhizobium laguerreae TaxID=1076926 RepID=UPI001C917FA4|nr:hypothetical protein [Rhizobium laguerreae]MBY3386434.1 hypothetical protein [Rhizobium laguerreae]MBY3400517.1 hypothetical protein [Rhizobium laguerreae]MBY3407455.1 hypothetical protein [Rhizobium laguerreae]
MQLANTIVVKEVKNTAIGELILFSIGRSQALGIVLGPRFPNLELCILRIDTRSSLTFHSTARQEESCISYGCDWILEPIIGSETISENFDWLEKPGILHLENGQAGVYFQGNTSENGGRYPDYIDLLSTTSKAPSRSALPVKRWRIWRSNEDMSSRKAEPLFTFDYEVKGEPK